MIFKKNRKKSMLTLEEYSYYIIKCLSISEENFFKTTNIQYNLFNQTLYYMYYLYICEQILLTKYNEEIVSEIILKSSDIILENQSKGLKNRTEFKNNIFTYLLYLKSEELKINEKERIA